MPRGSASVDEDHVPRTQKRELHGSNGCEHTALVCLHTCVSFCLEMGRPLVSGVITTRFFNFLNFLNFFFFAVTMDSLGGCWWEGVVTVSVKFLNFLNCFFLQ